MPTYIGLGITPERDEILADESGNILVSENNRPILALSTQNDLTLDVTGNLRMVYDAEAVGEHARQRLQFHKREWFLDPSLGVDWIGQVYGYAPTRLPIAEAIIKREILGTTGVTGLRTVSTRFDRPNRGLIVDQAEVETEFDEPVTL